MKEMKNKREKTVFGGIGIALLLCLLMVLMPLAATVSNGDTIEEISTETKSEKMNVEETALEPSADSSFNAEDYGYDADYEMLGMREQNSKVFIADDGSMDMIYSSSPLHYLDAEDNWQEIDFTIDASEDGYEAVNSDSPVYFEPQVEDGYSTVFGGEFEITSGVDSMLVVIDVPLTVDEMPTASVTEYGMTHSEKTTDEIDFEITPLFFETSQNVLTGGNKISYPLSDTIDLTYTVKQDKVKQEVVINALPHMYAELPEFRASEYFGLYERFEIPVGHHLISSDGEILTGVELFETSDYISIVNVETGQEISRIEAPTSHHATLIDDEAEIDSTYFLSVDEFGTSGSIITAVLTSSLLSEDISFPVTIDPTFSYVATGENSYSVCDISANNCHTKTDGRYEYNGYGDMYDSPRFPFQFGSTLPNGNALAPVESVEAVVYYDGDYDAGYADIIILEDCGLSTAGAPTGDEQLAQFANPSGCTGNALPAFTSPSSSGNTLYTYDVPTSYYRHNCYVTGPGQWSWSQPSGVCVHYSHFGYSASSTSGFGRWITADDGSTANGVFPAGTYNWELLDSAGNGLSSTAYYSMMTRSASWSVSNQQSGWSTLQQFPTGTSVGSSASGIVTIPAGQVGVLKFHCGSYQSTCGVTQNLFTIQEQAGVLLPALASGGNSLNRGPDATLSLNGGEEARMKWNCGTWCSENTILWREAGQSWSFTNSWDPNYGYGSNGVSYASNTEGVLIQNSAGTTMNLEFLVYDSYGDGTNGGSGSVEVSSLGTWGTVPATPWGLRQVSMVSSESLGYISVPSTGATGTRSVDLCTTPVECSDTNSPISMLTDAIENGGYVEFGLGFANSAVSASPHNQAGGATTFLGGEFYVDKFELIIDFEAAIDDTTPPVDMTESHYEGNSYIEGPRTLMLEVEDGNHAIDTTTANGPKLWYSIDNSNYISAPATLVSSVCNAKEQTCAFTAQTSHLSHGSVVDYYWTYQDASAPTATKPNQGPNPTQSATMQFTLVDPLTAGTAQKITTLVENVKANYDGGAKTPGNTIDRQMTYFTDTNEYLFEFDTSECETYTSAGYSCFSTDSNNDFGHWDLLWQDSTNNCDPGQSGCTGTSDNSLELDSVYGGIFDISRQFGAGSNLAFKYDSTADVWTVVGVGDGSNGLRIADKLDSNAPDTQSISGVVLTAVTESTLIASFGGTVNLGDYSNTATLVVPAGKEARLGFQTASWESESGFNVNDGTSDYQWGRTNSQPFWGNTGSSILCASSSGFNEAFGVTVWSDAVNNYNNCLPGNGVLPAGTYSVTMLDSYGDGSNGGFLKVQIQDAGGNWGVDPNVIPYTQVSSGSTYTWGTSGFSIDLSASTTPTVTTGSFAGHNFWDNSQSNPSGLNIICVTTNGLVYFKEDTSANSGQCPADADDSSNGGTWQGFALAGTVQGEQPAGEGMLWSIRNIAPDPDLTPPAIEHNAMGDSHALERTVSAVISDPGYQPTGLEVSSAVNVGPTLHYEVYKTSGSPTGTFVSVPMIPEGSRALCADMECIWSADLPTLSSDRDDSVVYKITAQDISAAGGAANNGPNTATTTLGTFSSDTPTNTLVIEWQNYASNFAATDECSFQTILYDVTNEFEFHYDESCSSDEIVGVIGHRLDQNTATTIENLVDSTQSGNPHSHNIRVTDGADGYSYEYFELGITTPLPLASSSPAVAAGTSASFRTENCVQQFWSTLSNYCAGNIDIPAGFSFDFHGTTYNGDNGQDDRIQVSAAGVINLLQNQPATSHTTVTPVHGVSWSGAMYDMNSGSPFYKDNSIAPWWSPASNDYCTQGNGCNGVWYRTIPFDGQGTPVTSDINVDTVWYLVDSPIRVNPTDSSGYLSVNANLEIEAGVEVIVAPGKGISFDSGFVNNACTQFTAGDSSQAGRVSFNADQTSAVAGTVETWYGLAFTDECQGATTDRHTFENVDISNTEYAAITAGSRPAPNQPAQFTCGTSSQDCNVGEFDMTGMTFTNVDSAFSHGSGQGTVMTMSNFDINGARSACFNFAENTIATLSGTPSDKSTMVDCNSNNLDWGGAVVSQPGSSGGSLTMSNIDITDSLRSLVRVDFKTVVMSNVDATNTANQDPNYAAGQWATDNSGVSLGLSHATGASVDISDFSAPNYHHGWIYAAGSVSMTNVDLGSGWANNHYFDIMPFGSSGSTAGATGADATFDNVNAPNLYMHRTFPGTFNEITTSGDLNFYGMNTFAQTVEMTGASDIFGEVGIDGCGSNIKITGATIGGIWSSCPFGNKNIVDLTQTTIIHDSAGSSAMSLSLTKATLIEVDVQSSVIDGTSSWYAYVYPGSELYLIASTYTDTATPAAAADCADSNGATGNCAINFNTGVGQYASEVYYGGYANALAYRLGVVNGVSAQQILQSDVTITTQTLDSTGTVVAEVGSALTGTNPMGKTDKVIVLTGNQGGDIFTEHIVRASGAAGIGDVKPGDLISFSNEVAQTPGTVFGDYTIGSYVDIRLIAPPVTFDSPNMDCNWMMNTNSTFMNAWDAVKNSFVFKGAALTVAADMTFDGCSIELEGSKMLFRSGTVTVMSSSVSNTAGSILMTIDGDTGDAPEIIGENGAKVVDLSIGLGGTVNMQAGSIQDMLVTNSKPGQLVVESGGTLIMANGAGILGSDLTGMGAFYPIVYADGGSVQVTSGQISGIGNTGTGLSTMNAFVNANGLTVSNAYAGVWGEDSALTLDGFTSTGNVYGVVAEGAMTLPKVYRSATLQGIDPVSGMDACIFGYWNGCGHWQTYSIDFSTYLGSDDYLQTGMELEFQGHVYDGWSGWTTPYITMDNLKITMSDNLGQSWTVDSSSDKGYYPYGSADPSSGTTAATYAGGIGGVPSWDCTYSGFTYSPYNSYGTYGSSNGAGSGTMGGFFGVGAWGYPAEFGFRWTASNSPNIAADPFPGFNWGTTHQYFAPFANFPGMNNLTPGGTVCGAVAYPRIPTITQTGSSGLLNFPVVDISDSSLTSVKMEVDIWHTYYGRTAGYFDNAKTDNAQVIARGSSNPASMGEWTTTLPNNGISIVNSDINDANIGVYLLGDTVATFTNTQITNPSSYGVYTTGENSVTFDNLDVTDNSASGATNYGFYSGSTSTGDITIKNSDFSGLSTSLYFNNDVGTTVETTTVSNGNTGLRIGSQSDADYNLDGLSITNMNVGVQAEGTGKLTITDCVFVSSTTYDVVLDDSRNAEFIDGSFSVKPLVDSSKVSILGSGTMERSRSYFAVLDADSSPVANANVILSSRDASVFSAGTTDSNGLASGLAFSVFTMDSVGISDLTTLFNTYTLTTVAQIGSYSYTDATTNSGDFRYKIASPNLADDPYDSGTAVNYEAYSLTDVVDVRICSNSNMHTVVANCAGTFADTDTRTYTSGMVEYGSEESIQDISGTVDMSNMVIMSDTGSYEMKDGTVYNLDGSTILMTGYMGLYNIGQWTVEQPYGTTFSMDGGSVLGIYPAAPSGAPIGYALGGLGGFSDAPLSFDVNNVDFNGIATMSAFAGDYASSSSWSGLSAYNVGQFKVTGSSFSHYRGFNSLYANVIYDVDTCIRLAGGNGGLIQNNVFNDCTAGIMFRQSDWLVDDSNQNTGATDDRYTQTPHPVNGSQLFTIDNNQFSGGAGFNIWVYNDANADQLTITNNDMNCNACEAHIAFYDETSVAPIITGNTMRNGDYAVTTKDTQLVTVDSNTISNIEVAAVYVDGGDADITGNTITDSLGAIRVEGLTKPTEQVTYLVAGFNTGMPESTAAPFNFKNFLFGRTSQEITFDLPAGDEMIMEYTCGQWCSESTIEYKAPNAAGYSTWNPANSGVSSSLSNNLLFTVAGNYKFSLLDSYGDGPNGGQFRVFKAASGTWATGSATGPSTVLSWTHNTLHSQYATGTASNDDGVVIENLGSTPTIWAFRMTDTFGDGANGNSYIIQEAPAGTWNGATGPAGVYVGGINDGIGPAFTNSNNNGDYSDWLEITLQPNKELRMVWDNCQSWCYESGMEYGEIPQAVGLTWVGPDIHNNVITNTGFEPNAYGIRIENCDMTQYHISTISNNINIGQDALVADSCTWIDQSSTLTGTDQVGSVGFNDDNAFGASVILSGTTISGFETGALKTSGDLTVLSGSTITAGANGIGLSTKDIDVVLKDSTFDGGATGQSILIENSNSATLDNIDSSGNDGPKFMDSEFTWTSGTVSNSGTALTAVGSTGDLTSLTFTGTGNQIDASAETYINSIDYSLDDAKMVVDATSIVDESNWLSIATDHLGTNPSNEVGLMITDASGNYGAYVSPTFNADSLDNTMTVDGSNDDWIGGNALNPSGYAMPGEISTDFFVTSSSSTLYMAFNGVTSADDMYVYFNTNDLSGSDTDFNDEHNLPFGAEQALVIDSTGASIYSSGLTGWTLATGAVQIDRSTSFVEISMPLSSLGSGIDALDIVATVQVGTDVSVAHPSQTIVGTGLETLTDSYSMNLGLLDLSDGTMTDQVMLYRSFFKSSTPTTGHIYDIMVKTTAESGQTCDYDWATLATESLSPILMDQSQSVSFDILRACPVITNTLDDVTVYEDSAALDMILATFVDDEQDVEATMKWDVTGDNLVAHDDILTDWTDATSVDGTLSITPINDQFGVFELEFEVVDSHGQTASKVITYTVTNVNDAPWICDALPGVDPNCDNGNIELYTDGVTVNTRYEGFASTTKALGDSHNDTGNSFVRDMDNENNIPLTPAQTYTWSASANCDQLADVSVVLDATGKQMLRIIENMNWEEGGICDITLDLEDDGVEFCFDTATKTEVTSKPESDTRTDCESAGFVWMGENTAQSVVVPFSVAPVNDVPVIADDTTYNNNNGVLVDSADETIAWVADGVDYKVTLVEDTTDSSTLTFDLSSIKSDIDHLDADLSWTLTDSEDCDSSNYYTHQINGDLLEFTLIADATTNAPLWEMDMLNNNGIHQEKPTNAGNCPMHLRLYDDYDDYVANEAAVEAGTTHDSTHPRYTNYTLVNPSSYVPLRVEVDLYVTVDNVKENVPDYEFRADSGFNFNSVTNIMPGTYVPVDFTIFSSTTTGDEGPYTYERLLKVTVHSDGHTELERPVYYTPPAYGESLFVDDWQVYITAETTEVWVEMDVVTCVPNTGPCTPTEKVIQADEIPGPSHLSTVGTNPNVWSEPGKSTSNRAPAFEDRNWCNNLMSTSPVATDTPLSTVVLQNNCQHTSDSYIAQESGFSAQQWQNTGQELPNVVGTIGALSVASFAPSLIAVCLTGLFVSVLVFSSRREDDEEDYEADVLSDDESAVSPVIATILMVAITVVLSGVVYVWAAQLADTDTKGVPIVTFTADNVESGSLDTDHWKIVVGQTASPLATQAIEVSVTYVDSAGDLNTISVNIGSTAQVYGFTPYNSPNSIVTFSDLVDDTNPDEPVSSFGAGDEIYVRTHIQEFDSAGNPTVLQPLVDARIQVTYSPPVGDGALLKTYTGMTWNEPV